MMKYIWVLLLSCFFSLLHAEGKKDGRLQYHTTLNEALKEAQQKNKPIFFNCYADWHGACHLMDSVVLADPILVSFIEKHCVPLRVDMVKTMEGRQLAEKYKVSFFAHFLILDPEGEVIHRIIGGAKAPEFLERLKRGLNPQTSLRGMNQRYEKGDRNLSFLADYAEVLDEAGETEKLAEVSEYYLKHVKQEDLYSARSWNMLYRKGMQYGSEWYQFIYDHRNELMRENGQKVTEFLVQSAFQRIYPYMVYDETNSNVNLFNEIKQRMEMLDSTFQPRQQLMDICQILILRQEKKYAEMLDIWEKCMDNFPSPVVEWYFDRTLGQLQDMGEAEKKRAATYLSAKLQGMPDGFKRSQYQNTVAQLTSYQGVLFETGSLDEALEKAKQQEKAMFVDCYTSWCGPCQMMSKRVFPQKTVGDFMNSSFVSIKIDMEKGEGVELAKRWKIDSFPTYLVLNAQGEVVYTSKGAMPAEMFIKKMEEGLTQWKNSVNK